MRAVVMVGLIKDVEKIATSVVGVERARVVSRGTRLSDPSV